MCTSATEGGLTGLPEQVLQVLPSYSVRELNVKVNSALHKTETNETDATNVGDVDLTTTTTTTSTHTAAKSATESTTSSTTVVATAASLWASESRFGLTILNQRY